MKAYRRIVKKVGGFFSDKFETSYEEVDIISKNNSLYVLDFYHRELREKYLVKDKNGNIDEVWGTEIFEI